MKSFATKAENLLRKMVVLADYLIWLLLDPSKYMRIDRSRIKKVLIIHLGAIGELMILTPLLPAIKKGLNNPEIDFMVSPGKEGVLRNNPHVDRILAHKASFMGNLNQIKSQNYDLSYQ